MALDPFKMALYFEPKENPHQVDAVQHLLNKLEPSALPELRRIVSALYRGALPDQEPASWANMAKFFSVDEEKHILAMKAFLSLLPRTAHTENDWITVTNLWRKIGEGNQTQPYLIFKPTESKTSQGLIVFKLSLVLEGKVAETITTFSGYGRPQYQVLLNPANHRRGNLLPLPEGIYRVGEVETIKGSFGPGIGSVWIRLTVLPKYRPPGNNRDSFGIHQDANYSSSPGSAGCIVHPGMGEINRIADWVRKHDIQYLKADMGFGTVDEWRAPQKKS